MYVFFNISKILFEYIKFGGISHDYIYFRAHLKIIFLYTMILCMIVQEGLEKM